ncbi:MAG: hypothetical protein ACOYIO_07145 [Eubacteriales bacterium]
MTLKLLCDGLGISLAAFFDTDVFRSLEQEMKKGRSASLIFFQSALPLERLSKPSPTTLPYTPCATFPYTGTAKAPPQCLPAHKAFTISLIFNFQLSIFNSLLSFRLLTQKTAKSRPAFGKSQTPGGTYFI